MPNRILRDSALDSDRLAAVSEQAEVLFYRLLMLADDFGRFDARVSVIRARAFALRQSVSEAQVIHRLQELCKVGLIQTYKVSEKPYLVIPRFGQRQRADKSKFPDPVSEVLTSDGHLPDNGQTYDGSRARDRARAQVVDVVVGEVVDVGDIPGSRRKFADDDPAASPVDKSTATKANGGNPIAYIPLNDGSEYPVSSKLATELATLYPAVDVPQTLNEIRAWNIANPTQRKTTRGVLRHINSWLAKEQNRGPQG